MKIRVCASLGLFLAVAALVSVGQVSGIGIPPTCDGEVCDPDENCGNCPSDCGACPVQSPFCGDGQCQWSVDYKENLSTCEQDCWTRGDGRCSSAYGEGEIDSPVDCHVCDGDVCALGVEDQYGSPSYCYQDCDFCGDKTCQGPAEKPLTCVVDCGCSGQGVLASSTANGCCSGLTNLGGVCYKQCLATGTVNTGQTVSLTSGRSYSVTYYGLSNGNISVLFDGNYFLLPPSSQAVALDGKLLTFSGTNLAVAANLCLTDIGSQTPIRSGDIITGGGVFARLGVPTKFYYYLTTDRAASCKVLNAKRTSPTVATLPIPPANSQVATTLHFFTVSESPTPGQPGKYAYVSSCGATCGDSICQNTANPAYPCKTPFAGGTQSCPIEIAGVPGTGKDVCAADCGCGGGQSYGKVITSTQPVLSTTTCAPTCPNATLGPLGFPTYACLSTGTLLPPNGQYALGYACQNRGRYQSYNCITCNAGTYWNPNTKSCTGFVYGDGNCAASLGEAAVYINGLGQKVANSDCNDICKHVRPDVLGVGTVSVSKDGGAYTGGNATYPPGVDSGECSASSPAVTCTFLGGSFSPPCDTQKGCLNTAGYVVNTCTASNGRQIVP